MKKSKLKIAFLSFFGLAGIGLFSGIRYLESPHFAKSVKLMISERSPQKLGVVGDFTNLKLYFFPPGVGVASPKIRVDKKNISQLPLEAEIEAKELRLSFAPIQMFSGVLQVSDVQVVGGSVQGTFFADEMHAQRKPKENAKLSWQDLFKIQINGFRLTDTYLNLKTVLPGAPAAVLGTELVVKELELKKARLKDRNGFVSTATVNAVKVTQPASWKPLPVTEANQLEWDVEFTEAGLKLNPFTADLSGIRVRLDGEVVGNLLDEKSDPLIKAQTQIHSDLSTFFLANLNQEYWGGELDAKASIQAQLKKLNETLTADFTVQGHQIEWKQAKAEQLTASGRLDLASKKIALKDLRMFSAETSGKTGSLIVSQTEIPLDFNRAFQTHLELKDADLHWLGGVVPKVMAPLDGWVSGTSDLQFEPKSNHRFNLHTVSELKVEAFGFTNQKFGVARPKHWIIRPQSTVKLHGPIEVSSEGVAFSSVKLGLNRTNLVVEGSVTEKGFALSALGHADLNEFKEIAENPIGGEGEIGIKVHGPSSGVLLDFDAKLKDAAYLGMNFGNVTGLLTFDENLAELRFQNVQANYKNTFYSLGEGFIDLSGGDDLHLPFDLHVGRVEDIAAILNRLTAKLTWLPKSLKGEVHGKIEVGGKLSTPLLDIKANLEGSDWTLYGERARRMKMDFGYVEGTYYARDVVFSKSVGSFKGSISYASKSEVMNWDFATENLSLLDVDLIDRLDIPAKSKIEFHSQGSGRLDHLQSKTEAKLIGTEIKGESFEDSQLNVDVSESTLRVSANLFGNRGSAQMKYALIEKQPSQLRVDLRQFDFSPALLVLNPKLLNDPSLAGLISGHVQLDFLSTQAELARGQIQFTQYELAKSGFSLKLLDPVTVPVQLGYFNFPSTRLKFKNSEVSLHGLGRKGDIDFSLSGQIDLAIAEFFSSAIQRMNGKADAELRLSGPVKDLKLVGDISFSSAQANLSFLQTPIEDMDAAFHLSQGKLSIEHFESSLGGQPLSVSGTIETFADRFPEVAIKAQFQNNKIKMSPLELVQVRGTAFVTGSAPPYAITGNLEVPQALWTKSFSAGSGAAVTRGDRFLPEATDKQSSSGPLNLDLNINAPQNFLVKNDIVDGEFRGKIKLIGPPENVKLLGEGQLVQGRVVFKDRPFILESVKVEFDDPYQMNPKFNASAISDVNQYKVRVLAYGRASSWKAEFSSTPFLPESEIFSLLASGYTTADTSRYKNRDRSYVSQGEAASLILHSMDFSKDVQSKTGFQFDVEEAIDNNSANSIFRPQNLSDNIAAPKLVIKRRVGRNILVSFGSTVGVGSENQKEVNAEYKLTPRMSALGVWNNIEEVNTKETRTSFGLDLKFNHRFR